MVESYMGSLVNIFLYSLALFVEILVLSGTVSLHYCQVVDDEFDSPLPLDVRVQT